MSDDPRPADPEAEIAALRAEVAALREALGEDVWRLRRLAELGVAHAKIHHDLRNLLSAALMVADRLQSSTDPKTSRSGQILVTAIEQATGLMAMTLDFAAEAAPLLSPASFPLAALIEELASEICAQHQSFAVENTAPADLHIAADRTQLGRALGYLLRTAAKAQAKQALVHVQEREATIEIVLTDDGRPFREGVSGAAFQPFSGAFRYGSTGLGLVIARELVEAHGGSIAIRSGADKDRTCVVLSLPLPPLR